MMQWKDVVFYDPSSPTCLRWKVDIRWGKNFDRVKFKIGDVAGVPSKGGSHYGRVKYLGIGFDLCHHVVWWLHGNELQAGLELDHINGDNSDNRIENLRLVERRINCRNRKMRSDNSTGTTCVKFEDCGYPRYIAVWQEDGKQRSKSFSIKKYGKSAYELACKFRAVELSKLIEEQGYTERHGKEI